MITSQKSQLLIKELHERGGEMSKFHHILVRTRADLSVSVWYDDVTKLVSRSNTVRIL